MEEQTGGTVTKVALALVAVLGAAVVEGQLLGIGGGTSGDDEQILTILVVIQSLKESDMVTMLKLVVAGMVRSCLPPSNMTRTRSLWDKALWWKQGQKTLPEGL